MYTGKLRKEEIVRSVITLAIVGGLLAATNIYREQLQPILKFVSLEFSELQSFLVFFLLFFLFIRSFGTVLIAPYVALAEAREEKTVGATEEAQRLTGEAEEINRKIKEAIAEVRVQMLKDRALAVQQATNKSQEILMLAETEAANVLAAGSEQILAEIDQIKSGFSEKSKNLAELLLSRISPNA